MSIVPIICDQCSRVFFREEKKIRKLNFCSQQCKNKFNSQMFSEFNRKANPMNMPGRTIDERAEMRERMLKYNQEQGKTNTTYNKYLGEPEHRRIARIRLGRELKDDEVVHHIDGNKQNNKPSNLQVMTKSEHARLHIKDYWSKRHGKK